jgi:hypothetical protein
VLFGRNRDGVSDAPLHGRDVWCRAAEALDNNDGRVRSTRRSARARHQRRKLQARRRPYGRGARPSDVPAQRVRVCGRCGCAVCRNHDRRVRRAALSRSVGSSLRGWPALGGQELRDRIEATPLFEMSSVVCAQRSRTAQSAALVSAIALAVTPRLFAARASDCGPSSSSRDA